MVSIAGGACRLEISFDESRLNPVQFSSWFTIWQAVVAINAMCVRNGQRGRWLSVGYSTGECCSQVLSPALTSPSRLSRYD